jgi:hypothetical protein
MVLIGSEKEPPSPAKRRRLRRLWLVPVAAVVVVAAVAAAVLATSGSTGPERSSRTASAQQASSQRHGSMRGAASPTTTPPPPPPPPPDARVLASGPLPGEGHWVPAGRMAVWAPNGRPVGTVPVVYTTTLRPGGGGSPTGLAWINTKLTKTVLYAGTAEPAGSWPFQGAVDPGVRSQLVAAFNSGFRLGTGSGGWYTAGRAALPLQNGYASLVVHADGSATVGLWGRDVSLTPDVVSVRQNLRLLVDGGAPANLGSGWGATLGGGSSVWRSAVGVDNGGNLIYAGGPGLDPASLANVLVAAGCIRAMELDINPQWVSFSTYAPVPLAPPDQVQGTPLLTGMNYGPTHWLEPSGRDFLAVFTR